MRINNISIHRNRQEHPPNAHEPIQYNRHNPGISVLNTPSKPKISNTPQHDRGKHEHKSEFRLIHAAVAFCHVAGHPVAYGAAAHVADHAEDPGTEADEADLAGGEVVLRAAEDLR